MKKYFIFTLIPFLLISCSKAKKEKITPKKIQGYHIIGTIESFNNKTVFLQKQNVDKSFSTIQKTTTFNNNFEFKGENKNIELVYIGFKESEYKLPVILNNFETIVFINTTDLEKSTVKGSKLQNIYNTYIINLKKAKNKFVFKTNFIKNNTNSPIAAIVLKSMLGKNKWRLSQNRKAFNLLDENIKKSNLGAFISSFLDKNEPLVKEEKIVAEFSLNPDVDNKKVIKPTIVKKVKPKKNNLPKRIIAPNFYAESLNGNDISLNQIRKNAKVTLIDFWASWCAPCRKANPHLVKLYNKYHKNGFNIVSISEDKYSDKNRWKDAVAKDGLIWYNLIDDNNRIANMFGVSGIPHTVLLDENGGIIFAKKTTHTIEKKLKEIFGY